jgi:hypothetical protein
MQCYRLTAKNFSYMTPTLTYWLANFLLFVTFQGVLCGAIDEIPLLVYRKGGYDMPVIVCLRCESIF